MTTKEEPIHGTRRWATRCRGVRRAAFVVAAAALLGACGDESATAGSGECPATTSGQGGGGDGGAGGAGATTSSTTSTSASTGTGTMSGSESGNNPFDHMNDPGESGQKDPFEILKERADEGPPEIRTRLHGCTKLRYAALGDLLSSRGVNLNATVASGPKPAGQLYKEGKDALGVAKFDAREAEPYFHTTSGATKLFDIFVQASPEIIANIEIAEACKVNGVGAPMFNPDDTCNEQALACIMGRPPKDQDVVLCNLMVAQNDGTAGDIARKKQVAVAAFLSAAHTCE